MDRERDLDAPRERRGSDVALRRWSGARMEKGARVAPRHRCLDRAPERDAASSTNVEERRNTKRKKSSPSRGGSGIQMPPLRSRSRAITPLRESFKIVRKDVRRMRRWSSATTQGNSLTSRASHDISTSMRVSVGDPDVCWCDARRGPERKPCWNIIVMRHLLRRPVILRPRFLARAGFPR